MGYLSIPNLYRPEAQAILEFKRLYALEKLHGTSAHISWLAGQLRFFSGGESHARFVGLFDQAALTSKLLAIFGVSSDVVTVFGEAYGGKQQGMSGTYGPELRFTAFDIKTGEKWLAVPQACVLVESLGLEFVPWTEISATLDAIDAERDRASVQAQRNGILEPKAREGIVLRPPFEVTLNNGSRLIAKHKAAEFSEHASPREIDPVQQAVLSAAEAIADEWVVPMRLEHVIDKLKGELGRDLLIQDTQRIITAMVEDVYREAAGFIVESKDARKAIGQKAARLFKAWLNSKIGLASQ